MEFKAKVSVYLRIRSYTRSTSIIIYAYIVVLYYVMFETCTYTDNIIVSYLFPFVYNIHVLFKCINIHAYNIRKIMHADPVCVFMSI